MRTADVLQMSTVRNMLLTELKRQGIEVAQDENDLEAILDSTAEQILFNWGSGSQYKDIQACVDCVKDFIKKNPDIWTSR